MAFELTAEKCELLKQKISNERLTPYLIQSKGNLNLALRLYSWNTGISESLYGIVQGYEIVLRNASHDKLSKGFGEQTWWMAASLRDTERYDIQDAEESLLKRASIVTPGRIVAELNLAFWTNLYSNFYEHQFWVKHLRHIFPAKMDRKRLHDRLESIKALRNRIAHHETLIRRDVNRDHTELLEAIAWISPNFRSWIIDSDQFPQRYANRPTS